MGRKQSGFAKRIRHEFDIEMQLYVNNRMQMAEDAAFMAANDILGLGAGRVFDLRKRGYDVETTMETGLNRYGIPTRYARYTLHEGR